MPVFQNLPTLKDGNVYNCASVLNDTLFVMGGCNIEGKAQKTVQLMNLSEHKEFIRINDMPRAKAGAAVVSLNNKVITLGGIYNKQCPLDKVDALDIGSNHWQELASLPCPVQGPIVAMKENIIYCGGGLTGDMSTLNTYHMMDMSIGDWKSLPNMISSHYHAGSFLYKNNLYVIGGRQGKLSVKDCECFDFRADSWRVLPSIPDEFRNIFCSYVPFNNQFYIIGGIHENPKNGFSNLVYSFDLINEKWEKIPNILKPRADFGAFCIADKLLIAGGMGQLQGIATSTEIYNPVTKRWALSDDLPSMHASSSKCLYEDSMFLVGGMSPTGPSTSVTEIKFH